MPTAQETAEAVRDALWARDRVAHGLGMQLLAIGPGTATLSMTVREDMLNGIGLCHGGLVTTLAHTAFGFASNSGNQWTVTAGMDIHLLAAANLGDVLTASACWVSRTGRSGVMDVPVINQRGEPVALVRVRAITNPARAVVAGQAAGPAAGE